MNVVSQFIHNPKEPYHRIVHRILQDLKGSPNKKVVIKKREELSLKAYTNGIPDFIMTINQLLTLLIILYNTIGQGGY